tara:strand:+ start:1329 stop:2240 length:912 start_codon:yes stop_codon:yes gene_type:complete
MKKLFIFGVGGLLGYRISLLAKNKFKIYGTYNERKPLFDFAKIEKLNILDNEKTNNILKSIKPDYVIITSALSNVDYCELHKEEAEEVNVDAVKKIFSLCEELNCKLIHISSDSVFDGTKKSPYLEEDMPNPLNIYGKTKLSSEKIILQNSNNLVIRASVLYGWLPDYLTRISSSSMKNNNFVQWLIQNLKNNKKVNIITDENSSPILVNDFARSIINLIEGNFKGIYHSSPPIEISRYDFSIKIANYLGYNEKLIHPVTNKELGRYVITGKNKCLNSNKISKETGFKFLNLNESIEELKMDF